MTQFQLFLVLLWLLWFVKPKFRKSSNRLKMFKDIEGIGSCVGAGAIFLAILVFVLWFHWTIAGILLPYVNHYIPILDN